MPPSSEPTSPHDGTDAAPAGPSAGSLDVPALDLAATRAAVARNAATNRASAGAYQEATCPICGRRFMVRRSGQVFDRDACRSRYNRLNRAVTEVETVTELERTRRELERVRSDVEHERAELERVRTELEMEANYRRHLEAELRRTRRQLTATQSFIELLKEGDAYVTDTDHTYSADAARAVPAGH